jgi:N-acetylmuramoyl-L-alanine amidase
MSRLLYCLLVALLVASCLPSRRAVAQQDARFFPETGYRVGDDAFWNYFRRRGGVRTFGYPVSNPFTLLGFRIQIFQREIIQLQADGTVSLMNVLDDGLLPYTAVNGSTFPASDPEVVRRQPAVGSPDYHAKALQFVKEYAPDVWQGMRVNFFRTFSDTVKLGDAFPDSRGDPGLLPGFNLEVWGLPTSRPTLDPANSGFVYLRFQRGIMHYDSTTGQTQGLLLADYVKSILTLQNLPPDLDAQAKKSRLYGQFAPNQAGGVARPRDLPDSDLGSAFRVSSELASSARPSSDVIASPKGGPTVLVDAGHGGREIGASYKFPDGATLVEKDLNLKVAGKVAQLLRQSGIGVLQSRTADSQVNASKDLTGDDEVNLSDDLQGRVDLANQAKASLMLSVHFNGVADPTKRGTQVFYADGRPFSARSRTLAELAQSSLVKQLRDAGYQTVDRKATPDSLVLGRDSHFYLLGPGSDVIRRPSEMPGIIGEALYVTNEEDARALRQDRVQDAIARGYVEAVKAYFARFPS